MDTSDLAFYVVQNSEGSFFRRKGYQGTGDTWVKDLKTARVWTKISGARATVTFFANHYPKYPPPKIVKLKVSEAEVIDETERVNKAKALKIKKKAEAELYFKKSRLERAKEELKRAQENFDKEN